jgi:hypothetical protein
MALSQVVVHASYYPDGTIKEIGERPEKLTGQQWFNFLCNKIPQYGQALAGGRHVFRVAATELDALKAEASA